MTTLQKIEKNIVRKAATNEEVELGSLWKDQSAVVVFLRRFG